jgi:nitrate reductase NapE component
VSYSGKTPTFCVFPVFSVAVMEKCCDACGDGEYYFRSVFRRYKVTVFQRHRLLLTGSRQDIRLVSYSGKTPTFCVFPVFSVAVMEKCCDACGDGEYYFGSGFRRCRVAVFQRHRLPLTGSRFDIRLVSYSGRTPTFCVFPVFSVAVMEKCCDACGDGEYYFRSGFSALQGDNVSEASTAVDRKSTGHTVGELSEKTPTFCVFPVFSVAVMEKCCDACGDGEYYFGRVLWRLQVDGVSEATTAVDRQSTGHTLVELH